ncbi:hypothetical protein [Rhizobium sp. BK251]|uniref:hypothetical protein n=1 Tax=Rhizobium sp. BK251 TaxID=2512125 RepID=UPI001051A334|nr:hypothetical protein [Rhizobium sp. BK251]
MQKYYVHQEQDLFSIIDEATQRPAKLDGVSFCQMGMEEARQILIILRSIDGVRRVSTRYASSVKKMARLVPQGAMR